VLGCGRSGGSPDGTPPIVFISDGAIGQCSFGSFLGYLFHVMLSIHMSVIE